MVEWVAVSAIATFVRTVHEIFRDIPSKDRIPPAELPALPPAPPNASAPERYQVRLGQRHKFLRKQILQLNSREMADFYGFERVEYLEDCEAGLDEFPTAAMQRLVQVFFISSKYLQEGKETSSIFQAFAYETDICRSFLKEQFEPVFLCQPAFSEDQLAYVAFTKWDDGYWRSTQSRNYMSFHKSSYISTIISAMLDLHLPYTTVRFLNVTQKDWEILGNWQWYNKKMLTYPGDGSFQAYEIFEDLYMKAYEQKYKTSWYPEYPPR